MPLYEFECPECLSRSEHWTSVSGRDSLKPACACGRPMTRLPGGVGLLWFEEGRGRTLQAFGNKPITSHAQHERLKRLHGVAESGNHVPERIRRNPKTNAMKEFLSKDHKGRWL